MVATVETGALLGVAAFGVSVEVSQTRGLPGLEIVGCPAAALRESRARVFAAISNSGRTCVSGEHRHASDAGSNRTSNPGVEQNMRDLLRAGTG